MRLLQGLLQLALMAALMMASSASAFMLVPPVAWVEMSRRRHVCGVGVRLLRAQEDESIIAARLSDRRLKAT